ncbi:hypothetical protein EV175_002306, partial [Coemansia sp. RSA 1933]
MDNTTSQVVRAVLSTEELAHQMVVDFARLVADTRDPRTIALWRRICADAMDVIARMD